MLPFSELFTIFLTLMRSNEDAFSDSNLKGYIDPLFPAYRKIIGKMITHVKVNITREIFSGFDTKEVNQNLMSPNFVWMEVLGIYNPEVDLQVHFSQAAAAGYLHSAVVAGLSSQ